LTDIVVVLPYVLEEGYRFLVRSQVFWQTLLWFCLMYLRKGTGSFLG